jgi:hypothetical protein
LTKELTDVNDVWFRDMDAAEIQQLCEYLERVLDNFDAAYHKARDKFGVH